MFKHTIPVRTLYHPASRHLAASQRLHVSLNLCNSRSTMSSSSTSSTERPDGTADDAKQPSNARLPSLPAPGDTIGPPIRVNVGGTATKLDHLGPVVVNQDGTLARISNWDQMTEIEQKNTLRILSKRNMLRLQALKDQEEEASTC
jgi:hypothetical protein